MRSAAVVVVGLVACAAMAVAQVKWAQSSAPASSGAGMTPDSPAKPVAPKLAGGKETGSVRALGRVAGESSTLCFQPGVGWQRVPDAAGASAGHPKEKAASPGIAGAHPFGTSQGISGQCGGLSKSSIAVEESKPASAVSSPSTTKPVSHSAVSLSPVAGSGNSEDAVQAFGKHAYISPIKLRRMMRNAPDLETRLKLQELNSRVAGNTVHPSGNKRPGKQTEAMRRSSTKSTQGRQVDSGRDSRAGQNPKN